MNKKSAWILPVLLVALAMATAYFSDTGDGAAYSSSTTGERGASLLFDTLRHMGYQVRASRRPLNARTNPEYVYIVIQPLTPPVTLYIADEMLEWVSRGGRLVFLCRGYPRTVIDRAINTHGTDIGDFRLYRHGSGEIITGRASPVTNRALIENSSPGQMIQSALTRWNSERPVESIFFAEYYHGFHAQETFIGRLPLVIQLIFAQMLILTAAALWHMGKRFGNPIPAYEEEEREENEYVHALARLYMETARKKS